MISIFPSNIIALTDDSAQSTEDEQAVKPVTEEKSLAYVGVSTEVIEYGTYGGGVQFE